MSYQLEVIEAAAHEHEKDVEGYGEYRARYLVCLLRETYLSSECFVVTFWNQTQNRAVQFHTGSPRYVTTDLKEAVRVYWDLLYPERQAV